MSVNPWGNAERSAAHDRIGLSHTLQSSSYGAAVQRSAFSYGVTYLALRLLKDGSLRHPGRNHEGGDPAAQTAEVE